MAQAQVPASPEAAPKPADRVSQPEGGEEMPKRFGKYTLIRRLAVGGMAELFLAIQRSMAGFEKLIVIKRVLPQLAQDTEFVEMLLDEARIAATLNHPNVAHIYDVGVFEGQYFIAMEHIHGEDLRSIVRQMKKKSVTSFPLEHALAIVLGCCAGLAYAHEKRDLDGEPLEIVHRDVSPQNILVTFSGDVKLVDFGIAKAGRSAMEETKSGKLKGKIPYMSPEQAQGEPLDARSDVFSLGVILFELCTGRRLFKGSSEFDTMRLIVEGTYPRPRSINPNLPPRLEEIIVRALAKDVSQRYQSAREMQGDLEGFIRAERLAVSPLSLGEWMQSLFSEKLSQQKQMLQEGRQLAEVIAAQVAEEEAAEASLSGVRSRRASKVPWILLLLVLLAAGGVAGWLFTRPPPRTGPPVGPGVIAITSEPPGAAIWLDGDRRTERTPAEIRALPVGATYTVKLTADGFVAHTERVELTHDRQRGEITATLERPTASSFGVVNVRTVPAGATVLFDGTDTGAKTPTTVPEIQPGVEHTLALSLDGYVTQQVTLTMRAGQVEDLNFELERLPLAPNESILRLDTVPEDARVQFDGEWYDSGSPYEFRVAAGRYRVVVAKSGWRNESERIALRGGQVTEHRIRLRPDRQTGGGGGGGGGETTEVAASGPGTLTFDARPWCNVSIDGQAVGQTPIVNRSLPSGRHRITCTNPELGVTRNVTVNIEPGQPTRQRISLE